jgi:hypothetical protein
MPVPARAPLDSFADIRRHAERTLVRAGVANILPVPLDDVAAALKLTQIDLADPGPDAPASLRAILAKLRSKTLGALHIPERTIYINPDQIDSRKRFTQAHEIGHDALPWQAEVYFSDDATTINPNTRVLMEREANAFAGELLFGAGRFNARADNYAPTLSVPFSLASAYGASLTAAARQYVERSARPLALLAVGRLAAASREGLMLPLFFDQCVESDSFRARYGPLHDYLPVGFPLKGSAIAEALRETTGLDGPTTELWLETTRHGRTRFTAAVGTNQRLNFVLLSRGRLLSGQTIKLVTGDGTST